MLPQNLHNCNEKITSHQLKFLSLQIYIAIDAIFAELPAMYFSAFLN